MRGCKKGRRGFTLTEAAILLVVVVGLALLLVVFLVGHGHRTGGGSMCANCLEQIGRAIAAYCGQYNDYYPYYDSPVATDSLTLVYPDFSANVHIFQCASTEDHPEINVMWAAWLPDKRTHSWFGDATGRSRAMPKWSSYGYDNRVLHAHAGANHVVAGDMDASWVNDKDSCTTNHQDGGNFLHWDGSVSWETTVYCSNNVLDNVFESQSNAGGKWATWKPETDSWIRRP